MAARDPFGARTALAPGISYYRLDRLAELGHRDVSRLPVTVKILLENALRQSGRLRAAEAAVLDLASPRRRVGPAGEIPFMPARVLLQDLTGVPCVVDLAALRSGAARAGQDPERVETRVRADLVIDHSVQVDAAGTPSAYAVNVRREFERNHERYSLLRWAQQAFHGFRVVPPGMGIVHQVNLEHLASVVEVGDDGGGHVAFPDTVVGTDSHTPMVNGIGVLGWGVGGIEAEAVMLGQPLQLLPPVVVGVRLVNSLAPGTTATDLVLTVTQRLRGHGVVGKFVEFCGPGVDSLSAADRATLSNMAPEYGATAALFPVDRQTLAYLRMSGRAEEHVLLVERYHRVQGMFHSEGGETPSFDEVVELDLAAVETSVAGPRRPQDRHPLPDVWPSFLEAHPAAREADPAARVAHPAGVEVVPEAPASREALADGSVVIAAITSCTNTSNPSVMLAAGLLAQRAVERGLRVPGHVKTSLAPGSRVVCDYLERAGLLEPLAVLGFNLVGYGCTTCIGNSGPLDEGLAARIEAEGVVAAAVLSGNRNFEGRIHPQVRASYLASPPLVVAYALAGTVRIDLTREPLGTDAEGRQVRLRDVWPAPEELDAAMSAAAGSDLYLREYARIFDGGDEWRALPAPTGPLYRWDPTSTYVREPPFLWAAGPPRGEDIVGARALVLLGDSVTTDHISPAGAISPASPAGRYLRERGVEPPSFNSYGARRGNHEVMVRGTFANSRLRNVLAGGAEGGVTRHLPSGEILPIYEAAMRYAESRTPLLVIAGREYGSGSSRDWAAKGPALLGVRAVIAESFERIHRGNLLGMGILPLELVDGATAQTLGVTGLERFDISGLSSLGPGAILRVTARADGGHTIAFEVRCRLDTDSERECYLRGGLLPQMLAEMTAGRPGPPHPEAG